MDPAVTIAGCGAVTALGCGLAPLAAAVRANTLGLRPNPRFAGPAYQTDVVGAVPRAVWDALDAADQPASRLAEAAIGQVRDKLAAVPPARRGLVLSTTKAEITALERLHAGQPCSDAARRQILPAHLAADLAAAHDIAGPVRCVSVACVSGLVALQLGGDLVRRGAADAVLVVGVDLVSHFVMAGFTALRSLEPGGCRPFDRGRVGLSLGEGAGAVVLAAGGSGWRIAGGGGSNDANHLTGPSRDGSGLALAIGRALREAGVSAREIGFVQAHGTGTPYNDRMEALALRTVFGDRVPPFNSCKGMIGHTLGAAGILETILCLVALDDGLLPGTPGFATRDPEVPESLLATPQPDTGVRCVLKINSGFGGTNAALVLEREAP